MRKKTLKNNKGKDTGLNKMVTGLPFMYSLPVERIERGQYELVPWGRAIQEAERGFKTVDGEDQFRLVCTLCRLRSWEEEEAAGSFAASPPRRVGVGFDRRDTGARDHGRLQEGHG